MSIRMPSVRRTATVVAAALLTGASMSVAAADPPGLEQDSCSTTLAKVTTWPGTMAVGGAEVGLVSDAFDSYLSRRSPCTTDRSRL
jgi:hypothetical protein